MIKYIITILIGLIANSIVGQGIDLAQDSVLYLTEEEEAFMLDKETGFLFKIIPTALEIKSGKSLSISGEMVSHFASDDKFLYFGIGLGLGMRYYYQMANRINTGKQANNLSGKYIGLRGTVGVGVGVDPRIDDPEPNWGFLKRYTLSLGEQLRIGHNNFIDYSALLSYDNNNWEGNNRTTHLTLTTNSIFGFAIGKYHKKYEDLSCPIVRCHTDRNYLLSTNITNPFSINRVSGDFYSSPFWFINLDPSLQFEKKIAQSSFSIVQKIKFHFNLSNQELNGSNSFRFKNNSYSYSIGSRYYFNLRKEILKGNSGNNLSGPHAILKYSHTYRENGSDHIGYLIYGVGFQKVLQDNFVLNLQLTVSRRIHGDEPELQLGTFNIVSGSLFSIAYILK